MNRRDDDNVDRNVLEMHLPGKSRPKRGRSKSNWQKQKKKLIWTVEGTGGSVPAWIMICQCFSVFCHLSRRLVSGHILSLSKCLHFVTLVSSFFLPTTACAFQLCAILSSSLFFPAREPASLRFNAYSWIVARSVWRIRCDNLLIGKPKEEAQGPTLAGVSLKASSLPTPE